MAISRSSNSSSFSAVTCFGIAFSIATLALSFRVGFHITAYKPIGPILHRTEPAVDVLEELQEFWERLVRHLGRQRFLQKETQTSRLRDCSEEGFNKRRKSISIDARIGLSLHDFELRVLALELHERGAQVGFQGNHFLSQELAR